MLISRKRSNTLPPPQLILNGVVLDRVQSYKYLGLTLTSNMSWSPHINICCNKTRKLIGLLYRRFYQHASSSTLLKLYCSFLRPHLEYASIVWNPSLKGEIDRLEEVQKFALRVCLKSWDTNYEELLASSNLPSLSKRRLLASLCHLFKISRGLTDYDEAPLHAQVHIHNTRASCKQMFSLPQCRTNSYQHSFFPNAISIWNNLPKEVIECSSVQTFKNYAFSSL